jgi:hypothetical protein
MRYAGFESELNVSDPVKSQEKTVLDLEAIPWSSSSPFIGHTPITATKGRSLTFTDNTKYIFRSVL